MFLTSLQHHFIWSYGAAKPSFWMVAQNPILIYLYLPTFLLFFALVIFAAFWLLKRIKLEDWLWVPALIGFGLLYWASNIFRGGNLHLQFSFLPAVIVTGLAFSGAFKPFNFRRIAVQLSMLALLIPGVFFFKVALPKVYKGKNYYSALGVRLDPVFKADFDAILKLEKEHGSEGIDYPYPYNSWVYSFLLRKPELPFDSMYYTDLPIYRDKLMDSVKQMKGKYMLVIHDGMPWDFPSESIDLLFDYIDMNYRVIFDQDGVWIYERRPAPVENSMIVKTDRGPYEANKENNYTLFFAGKDAAIFANYVEFNYRFEYPLDLLKSYSMPIVECSFDGKWWLYTRNHEARQRLNPVGGSAPYRIYLHPKVQQLVCQFTFPGL